MSIRQAEHAVELPRPLIASFGNISLAGDLRYPPNAARLAGDWFSKFLQ